MSDFYERCWQKSGWDIGDGFALKERKEKLRNTLAKVPAYSRVLDAGFGNGEFSRFLSDLGYIVDAIDIFEAAREKAHAVVPDIAFSVVDLEGTLPFPSEHFAAIWCTEVLKHIFDVHHALAELNRMLQPQRLLILTTPYHGLIKNLVIALTGFERHYHPYLSQIRFFSRGSLTMCLKRAGFTPIQWSGIGRFWPFWMSHFVVALKSNAPGPAPGIVG